MQKRNLILFERCRSAKNLPVVITIVCLRSNPGSDHRSVSSQMVSRHELEHTWINQTSVYGFLLQDYAQLSEKAITGQENFKAVFSVLVENCKLTHECGATLSGVMTTLLGNPDTGADELLSAYPEYSYYYELGEQIAGAIPGYYLKRLTLMMCVGIAMQGKAVPEKLFAAPMTFSAGMVRGIALPDNRLLNICKNIPATVFRSVIERFLELKGGDSGYDFIRKELQSPTRENFSIEPYFLKVNTELSEFIYEFLRTHFDRQRSSSYGFDEHLEFREQWIGFTAKYYIAEHPDPFDNYGTDGVDRMVFLAAETEETIFSENPLPCYLLRPWEVNQAIKQDILKGDVWKNLVLMIRDSSTLRGHYSFKAPDQQHWWENDPRTIHFIRHTITLDGHITILIIPFDTFTELHSFIAEKPHGVNLLGCISLSVLFDREWPGVWGPPLTAFLDARYFINDVSLVAYIEGIEQKDFREAFYFTMALEINGTIVTLLLMKMIHDSGEEQLIIVPCGQVFSAIADEYISKNYPWIVFKEFVTSEIFGKVYSIMRALHEQESQWLFRMSHHK